MKLLGKEWWIVEADELGRTAMPSRVLAYQGAEVIRGLRYKVNCVRRANLADFGDQVAIRHSAEEINSAGMDLAIRAGLLTGPQKNGPTQKIAAAH